MTGTHGLSFHPSQSHTRHSLFCLTRRPMVLTEYAQPVLSFFTLDCILDDDGNSTEHSIQENLPVGLRSLSQCRKLPPKPCKFCPIPNFSQIHDGTPRATFATTHNRSGFASVINRPIQFSHVRSRLALLARGIRCAPIILGRMKKNGYIYFVRVRVVLDRDDYWVSFPAVVLMRPRQARTRLLIVGNTKL